MSSAAPASQYLPVPALEARHGVIAQLLRSLGTAEREAFGVTSPGAAGASDEVDRANSAQGRDSATMMTEVLSANQDQIDHAMQRIARGRYGFCEDCERPITAERLQAAPEATRCIECQRHHERSPDRARPA